MTRTRLDAPLASLEALPGAVGERGAPVTLRCEDGDSVMMAGALHGRLARPVGVWLEVSTTYHASLAARDVATLAWLIDLDHVVVSAERDAASHAEVVAALLSDDEVNFTNAVAAIAHAYNRPAPPTPVEVWSFDGAALRRGGEVLRESSRATSGAVTATTYD